MPFEVIMPALGMAQDTGVVAKWHKMVGDPIAIGDVLLEVETDKAVMEIEAQVNGFLTELNAENGEVVPVGQVIALIGDSENETSSDPANATVQATQPTQLDVPTSHHTVSGSSQQPKMVQRDGRRVLASPKARRLAAQRGLDFGQLAASGHPQPYHVADLDHLIAMLPEDGSGSGLSVEARIPASTLDDLLALFSQETKRNSTIVFAAFASGAIRTVMNANTIVVRASAPNIQPETFVDADRKGLESLEPMDSTAKPDLIVHDLTSEQLVDMDPDPIGTPILSVAREGGNIKALLVAAPGKLESNRIHTCLDEFICRLNEPLRHLL